MIRNFVFIFIRTLEALVKKLVVGVNKKIKMNNSESIDLENINLEGNIEVPKKAEVTQQTKAAFG